MVTKFGGWYSCVQRGHALAMMFGPVLNKAELPDDDAARKTISSRFFVSPNEPIFRCYIETDHLIAGGCNDLIFSKIVDEPFETRIANKAAGW